MGKCGAMVTPRLLMHQLFSQSFLRSEVTTVMLGAHGYYAISAVNHQSLRVRGNSTFYIYFIYMHMHTQAFTSTHADI